MREACPTHDDMWMTTNADDHGDDDEDDDDHHDDEDDDDADEDLRNLAHDWRMRHYSDNGGDDGR